MTQHRRRRVHRRRSNKRTRYLLLLVGSLSLALGAVLVPWSWVDDNTALRRAGQGYLAVGGLLLLLYLVAFGMSVWARARDEKHGKPSESGAAGGFALLAALLLLALLSGVVVHAMSGVQVGLRQAHLRQGATVRRLAATDAAWDACGRLARGESVTSSCAIWPTGPTTTVSVTDVQRAGLPAPLLRAQTPVLGRFFAIRAVAANGQSSEVQGYACRVPGGDVHILGWAESP